MRSGRGHSRLVPELDCSDLRASMRFYVDLISFTVLYERREDGFAFLDLQGAQLMLEQAGGDWQVAELVHPFGRGINIQIKIDTIDPVLARLAGASYPLFRPQQDRWYRMRIVEIGNREFLVQDPDGYLLRFFQDLGRRPLQRTA